VDYGIIAIENKVAGSILLNYQLIENYNLHIIGESYLPIELKLLGKPGTKLSDIKEVISHPMALGQSQLFLAEHEQLTVTEYKDTASCAKLVANHPTGELAVIAGPAIAEAYRLEVVDDNVGDVKHNFTRFYILSKGENYVADPNKASITLRTKNEPGKLSDVLSVIKSYGLNLTKIQSVPVSEDAAAYSFHLDIEFVDRAVLEEALIALEKEAASLKVLGIYKADTIPQLTQTLNLN
jgi:prephenate dehydratase